MSNDSPAPLPLKEHQKKDIEWIHDVGRGLLANEPGLGKSRSAIEAFDGGNNLVIAPNLVIQGGTWEDELNKWSADPSKWTVVPYSQLNRRAKTPKGGTSPIKAINEAYDHTYDSIVVDEAHYTKGRNTSWTWAVENLAKRADSTLMMTGTPMPNWAHELYSLLRVLFPKETKADGVSKLGSYWRWAGEWFVTAPNRYSRGKPVVQEMLGCVPRCAERPWMDPCEHYQRFATENLGDRWRRVLREDALDLPPITVQDVRVPMDTAQRKAYTELKKQWMTNLHGDEVVAWSQGALNVALDRVTTSTWCVGGESAGFARGGKFEQLRYDLESRSRPTLVLAHYRVSVEGAAEIARQVGATAGVIHGGISDKDKSDTIRKFKDGKLDVLVGSLETLAEGLTLTVADMAIFLEMSYKPSRNEQARYRIHRIGQDRPVTIREYVTPNTVDSRKRKLLATKTDQTMKVMTAAQFTELI